MINKLVPELMDCLDIKKINISVALIFAGLNEILQKKIYECILQLKGKISIKMAEEIKECVLKEK